jgi:hypothetical protein
MPLSLAEAAAATGTNRTTILRAIKGGKVSASQDAHGAWVVEPAELHRVYPPVEQRTPGDRTATHYRALVAEAALTAQLAAMRDVAELLRAQLEDFRKDRDHWRDQAQAVTRQLAAAHTPEPTPEPAPAAKVAPEPAPAPIPATTAEATPAAPVRMTPVHAPAPAPRPWWKWLAG